MKMKRYIAAGILATALLASGCGKFVRDELITMQNEIDQLTKKVSQMMNQDLAALSEVVTQMENGGYVTSTDSFMPSSPLFSQPSPTNSTKLALGLSATAHKSFFIFSLS